MTGEQPMLGGRYELGSVLGRGGMAEVRRAHDQRLGRTVAIKQLRTELAGDATFQARFRREAQAAAGLNHPNIVSVYDTGVQHVEDLDIPYIVMEFVDGPTLRDVLRAEHKILPDRAFELTQGVLDALQYSHKAGIIHRDIKPANVMLTKSGQVKVMDFGIARAVSDTAASMTQTAAVIGTAQYLSPEQARGETVDARSDVYSAGCLLYELLTGRPPFVGESPVSVAYQHVRETPVAPSLIGEGDAAITQDMDRIVLKSLAKHPDERYESARDMREDISRLLGGQAVTAVIPVAYEEEATRMLEAQPAATQAMPAYQETTSPQPEYVPTTAPQRAVQEPPRTKSSAGPIIATIAVILVVALLAFLGWTIWHKQHPAAPAQVSVPAVKGYSVEAAKSRLSESNLEPKVREFAGPADSTVGQVTDQDPAGGSKADPGSVVTITVNVGPERVEVPKVTGMSKDDAEKTLKAAGFTVNPVPATDEPGTAKAGEVLSTNPGEGTQAPKGSSVTITYAKGDAKIPNVQTLDLDSAKQALTEAGFSVIRVQASTDSTCQTSETAKVEKAVCKQDPASGTAAVSKSTPITLYTYTPLPPSPSQSKTTTPPPATLTPRPGNPTTT